MLNKSVISLIAYDAHLLPNSIKSYYDYVDEIVLGLDENRISWSKNKFTFDENKLWSELQKIDGDNKISIVEGNFHKSDIALENDNFQRNYLKEHCSNDWIFSFDADEELVNAKAFFIDFCPIVEKYHSKIDLSFYWILPYKEFEDDYLMIGNNDNSIFMGDTQGFVTHKNATYTYCRWTNNSSRTLQSPLVVLHWSFCRDEKQLELKLNNFGHSDKSSDDPFFDTWKQINLENFENLTDFKSSGYGANQWNKLLKLPKKDFKQIIRLTAEKAY